MNNDIVLCEFEKGKTVRRNSNAIRKLTQYTIYQSIDRRFGQIRNNVKLLPNHNMRL